ncbi:MAG: hypothetical protein ACYDBJ_26050 [Aggregatilineales bacterium]
MSETIPTLAKVPGEIIDWRASQGRRYPIRTVLTVALLAILIPVPPAPGDSAAVPPHPPDTLATP